ncbi:hypothetical protein E2C01_082618 [Portunus trituberculatus]|uniref:Secreted protein n=1 Tax=Portunus trituberculatus TaxID=210409 RepID=A0A5B7IYY0_PORTR|nr:hypothetical protein [Portunus trituberculatus]
MCLLLRTTALLLWLVLLCLRRCVEKETKERKREAEVKVGRVRGSMFCSSQYNPEAVVAGNTRNEDDHYKGDTCCRRSG